MPTQEMAPYPRNPQMDPPSIRKKSRPSKCFRLRVRDIQSGTAYLRCMFHWCIPFKIKG